MPIHPKNLEKALEQEGFKYVFKVADYDRSLIYTAFQEWQREKDRERGTVQTGRSKNIPPDYDLMRGMQRYLRSHGWEL